MQRWELAYRGHDGPPLVQAVIQHRSGEAELNIALKGVSEAIGVSGIVTKTLGQYLPTSLHVVENACKGMLSRQGVGRTNS